MIVEGFSHDYLQKDAEKSRFQGALILTVVRKLPSGYPAVLHSFNYNDLDDLEKVVIDVEFRITCHRPMHQTIWHRTAMVFFSKSLSSSAGTLLTPGDFPPFRPRTALSTSSR